MTTVVAVALIAVATIGFVQRFDATHGEAAPLDDRVVTTTGEPDETPPDPACLNDVPAAQPKRIALPSIDVTGCMQRVGIDDENRIATPSNLHVAGWFVDSPLPGTATGDVSIVVGHQTGKYVGGIFDHLDDIADGDEFSIEMGDGTERTFRVTDVATHSAAETMPAVYADASATGSTLALITCSGPFDRAIDQRRDRLVVLAVDASAA